MGQTRQELFDRIVKFARIQGARSFQEERSLCMYRESQGRMCFVGALIPDDLYIKEVEGRTVRAIVRAYPEISRKVLPSDLAAEEGVCFLVKMQYIHDKIDPSAWEAEFSSYATREGLTLSPAEDAPQCSE